MKKYSVILADPPWQYKDALNCGKRGAVHKYGVLSLKMLCDLNIQSICKDDCVLFLWATFPLLPDALKVMDAWGFKYKTGGFTWAKTSLKSSEQFLMGLGHYTRQNAEPCLLGVRGNRLERKDKGIHSLVVSPRLVHSKKPPEVRKRIDRLYGKDVSKIELFARDKEDGWDATGLEFDGVNIVDHVGLRNG